jgi:hypothetical protein
MSEWINFKELRRDLNFADVLKAYGVFLNVRETPEGRQHKGQCPLRGCKDNPASQKAFSANLDKGVWRCFTCKCQGNILDFIIACEGLNSSNGADVRKAALLAKKKFLDKAEHKDRQPPAAASEKPAAAPAASPVRVNEPLDFKLRTLDANHQWFKEYGYDTLTVEHFGSGYV